jgi:hypothetical protein
MIIFYFLCFFFVEVLYNTTSYHSVSGTAANYSQPIIGIVALQRDEEALLTYWLEYHSKIVDLKNLLVLDNHSEDPKTLKILHSWAEKGLRVLFHQGPYTKKGELTAQAYHHILPHVDVIVPLDVDEFLFAYDGDQPIISKTKILSTLTDFWNQQNYSCLSLQNYYPNANLYGNENLETVDHFVIDIYELRDGKKVGKARDVVHYDHGNHAALFRCRNGHGLCIFDCATGLGNLGLLHYHFVNPEYVARRAIKDSVSFGYLPAGFTLEKAFAHKEMIQELANQSIPGHHKLEELWKYVSHGPQSVLKSIDQALVIVDRLPEIVRKISTT